MHQTGADFGTLQIPHDGDGTPALFGKFPDGADDDRLGGLFAVGKIETENVDPGLHQGVESFLRIAGRSNGGNDLGATKHGFSFGPHWKYGRDWPLLR